MHNGNAEKPKHACHTPKTKYFNGSTPETKPQIYHRARKIKENND